MSIARINECATPQQTISRRCIGSYRKLLAGIEQVKKQITNEFQEKIESHSQSVQMALREAEALAWQSGYPQLLFPTLAMERVEAAASWQLRQSALQKHNSVFAEPT